METSMDQLKETHGVERSMKSTAPRHAFLSKLPMVMVLAALAAASLACTVGVAPRSVLDTATPPRASETRPAPIATASPSSTATAALSPSATATLFVPPSRTPIPPATVATATATDTAPAPTATPTDTATGPTVTATPLGGGSGVLIYHSSVISTA